VTFPRAVSDGWRLLPPPGDMEIMKHTACCENGRFQTRFSDEEVDYGTTLGRLWLVDRLQARLRSGTRHGDKRLGLLCCFAYEDIDMMFPPVCECNGVLNLSFVSYIAKSRVADGLGDLCETNCGAVPQNLLGEAGECVAAQLHRGAVMFLPPVVCWSPAVHFAFPKKQQAIALAVLRCTMVTVPALPFDIWAQVLRQVLRW
jgi:hypothetical protein